MSKLSLLSKCCSTRVKVAGSGITHYYVCLSCGKPCDTFRDCEDCIWWYKAGECPVCKDAHCLWDGKDTPPCQLKEEDFCIREE